MIALLLIAFGCMCSVAVWYFGICCQVANQIGLSPVRYGIYSLIAMFITAASFVSAGTML